MQVVIISDFATPNGGAAKVAIDSARALAELGEEVVFIYGTGPVAAALEHGSIDLVGLGLSDVWSLPALAAARQGIWNAEAAGRLEAALRARSQGGSIVHVHQWTKVFSPSIFATLRKLHMPT